MLRVSKPVFARAFSIMAAVGCLLTAPSVLAQATTGSPITEDSQVLFQLTGSATTFESVRGVAVSPVDGTIYVADPTHRRVVRITPTNGGDVSPTTGDLTATGTALTPTITLTTPTAVAVNSLGALYIADAAGHQLIEMANPETSNTAVQVSYLATRNPVALAIDTTAGTGLNTVYVADSTAHAIYKVPSTGGAGTKLTLASAIATPVPVGLAVDGAHNLYYADGNTYANNGDRVYEYSSTGVNSVYLAIATSNTYTLNFSSGNALVPIGMGFDPAGNLYVLDSGVSTTTSHLLEVPIANDFYVLPFTNLSNLGHNDRESGLAIDTAGNLVVSDSTNDTVNKLFYNNPLNFGDVDAETTTASIVANFQFNTAAAGMSSYQNVSGDYTGEFAEGTNTCGTSQAAGTSCYTRYTATYQPATPGLRAGAFGFKDNSAQDSILAVLVNGIDVAGAISLYPGTQATLSLTTTPLYEPQGIAVTGGVNPGGVTSTPTNAFTGNLFIADEGADFSANPVTYPHSQVWQYPITSNTISSTPTSVGSGIPAVLNVALDPEGDLYIVSYGPDTGNGGIYVIQPAFNTTTHKLSWTGSGTPLTTGTVTLNHPMVLAFDPSGNLFIGDMGPEGTLATADSPGFIVEIPHGPLACSATACTIGGAAPFKLTNTSIGGIPMVFPQSLTTDNLGNLFIADGGDGATDAGGLDVIPAPVATSTASQYSTGLLGTLSQPTGLNFDAANDLYILDSYNERVVVTSINEATNPPSVIGTPVQLGQNQEGEGTNGLTSALVTPSDMVVWPGGQDVTIEDIGYAANGGGTPAPVQVLTLQSFGTTVNAPQGSPALVYGVDVGSAPATFNTASYSGPTVCTFSLFGVCLATGPAYSLTGCLNSGTLEAGVSNTCTATVTNNGVTGTGVFTLNGTGDTNSTLQNTITVTGSGGGSTGPIGSLSPALIFSNSRDVSVTLTNVGSETPNLIISSIVPSTATVLSTGTCKIGGTGLAPGASCTINFQLNGDLFFVYYGSITVNDNGTGPSNGAGQGGTSQTAVGLAFIF